MTKKRKRWTIAGIVILFLLSVVFLIVDFVSFVPPFDSSNTYEMSATLNRVERVDEYNAKDGKTFHGYYIYTNEYACPLVLEDGTIFSETSFELLNQNEIIYFRINIFAKDIAGYDTVLDIPGVNQVSILSLRTNSIEILTLDDTNKELQKSVITGKIFCTVVAVCFLAGAIVLLVFLIKKIKKNQC